MNKSANVRMHTSCSEDDKQYWELRLLVLNTLSSPPEPTLYLKPKTFSLEDSAARASYL